MKKTILFALGIFGLMLLMVSFMTQNNDTYYRVHTEKDFYYIVPDSEQKITKRLERLHEVTLTIYDGDKYTLINGGELVVLYRDDDGMLWVRQNHIRNEVK